jgi:membrane protease subunit HflK
MTGRRMGADILRNDSKGPWGSGGGGGSGDGGSGGGQGGGPRNPWAFPPSGKRGRGSNPFEDWLSKARRGGGGGNFLGDGDAKRWWLLAAAALVVLWLAFTSFHSIAAKERGVVTVLGSYSGRLEPGLRMTLPYPFASVTIVDMSVRNEVFPENGGDNLVLTQDQNIINLSYSVNWQVANPEDYSFQIRDQQGTVRAVAESAMRAVIATVPLNAAIGSGQDQIAARVQQVMQQVLDGYNAGVQIQTVAIRAAVAPQQVDEAFKAVSAAEQRAQAQINNARAYAQQKVAAAQGETAQFDKLYEQYKLAPEVTKRRLYYETMEQVLAKSNKTIIEAPGVTPYLALPQLKGSNESAAKQGGAQ